MTKKMPARVTICPLCGGQMRKGGRVRVTLGFEYPKAEYFGMRSSSRFVCSSCGERIEAIATETRGQGNG